ncbi:MAG: 50S ribosomal protein L24 [Flavobacteriaceae bacterium]|jgi:large subunit ribosomal protein L24|nr:50S ribosomal protein L24 [Flavobacteriaceae bacterium]
MSKIKLKNGDKVRVIAGDHKGTEGEIVTLIREKNKAIVSGVNVVKRHTKPNAQNPQGGIIEKEAPIAISNLSLLTAEGQTTRTGYRMEEGKKVRVSRKTNEAI